jgi:hypothetical protein
VPIDPPFVTDIIDQLAIANESNRAEKLARVCFRNNADIHFPPDQLASVKREKAKPSEVVVFPPAVQPADIRSQDNQK